MTIHEKMADLISQFRNMCFNSYPEDIEVISKENRRQLSGVSLHDGLPPKAQLDMADKPVEYICRLAKTPRLLKVILRRTHRAWKSLHGEINLDDILIANTLKFAAPESFDFLLEHYEEVRSVPIFGSQETRNKRLSAAEEKWEQATKAVEWDTETAKSLITYLFPGWAKVRFKAQALQGINDPEYWARFLSEEPNSKSFLDQEILRLLTAIRDKVEEITIHNTALPLVLCTNEELVHRFEYLAPHSLTGQEIRQVASTLFEQALDLQGVKAFSKSIAGFIPLWRLATQQPIDEAAHLDWVKAEIFKALPNSLHFANDIYYYWSSNSEPDIHKESHLTEFHAKIVSHARELFEGKPNDFIRTLDPLYMYSSFHFSVLNSAPKQGGPGFIADNWRWFALLLLDAGEINHQVIVPQIASFLIDGTMSGSGYTYNFNEKRCSVLFGDQRTRLMEILASTINVEQFDLQEGKRIQLAKEVASEWLKKNM